MWADLKNPPACFPVDLLIVLTKSLGSGWGVGVKKWLKTGLFWWFLLDFAPFRGIATDSDSVIRCWRDCVCGEQSLFRSLRIRLPGISRCKARLVLSRLCYKLVNFIQKSGINSKNLFRHETDQIYLTDFFLSFPLQNLTLSRFIFKKFSSSNVCCGGWGCGVGHAGKAGFNISRRVRRSRALGFVC